MTHTDIIQIAHQMVTFLERENALLKGRDMNTVLSMVDDKVALLLRYKKAQEWIQNNPATCQKWPGDSFEKIISCIRTIIQLSSDNEDRLKRYIDASERVMGRLLKNMSQKNAQIDSYTAKGRLQKPNFNGAFAKNPGGFQFSCAL